MPKAPTTFSQEDEEEKTTIESGWEEEASTTVEQGEVAEKIRSLANGAARVNTNITSTNGGAMEELTVDDQRAHAALSLITPSVAPARVVVTAGNDKGQELEIRPGKTYTIGRAIDNDFVLTDIAVSRKHFDLRHENGTWIVVDRGSGNGTVINGQIEDHPFSLMNGDAIEIGNTTFRFDHANQPARGVRPSYTVDLDEEEPSTVAGKPLREDIQSIASPAPQLPPLPRPKTVPPPMRPRSPSSVPPIGPAGYAGINGRSAPPVPSAAPIGQPMHPMGGPIGVPMASPTAPTVQPMHNMPAMRPQMGPMGQPQMLDQNGMLRPQMMHGHEGMQPLPGMMPTTIPGQGPPVAPSQPQVPAFSYPGVADIKPQLGQLQINGGIPRDATSTALVQPAPYGMPMGMGGYGVAQPQPSFSKKLKLLIGGALLMVLAAIATIAIIKSSSSNAKPKASNSATPTEPKKEEPAKIVVTEVPKPPVDDAAKKAEEARKLEEARRAEEQKKLELAKQEEQKKLELAKQEEARKAEELRLKKEDQAKKKLEAKLEAQRKADEARQRKLEQQKLEQQKKANQRTRREPTTTNSSVAIKEPTTSTNANTSSRRTTDTSDVKAKADTLYRGRKFKDAANTLRSAAANASEADARELRSTAAAYEQVGNAYNIGMGPATPSVDAYTSLVKAMNLDRPFGVYTDEIKTKLATVAPKAATKFMADKNYEAAFNAVRIAEGNGGGNTTTQAVRGALVDAANDLYQQAMNETDSNKDGARAKLQRIRGMVDGKASVLVKAERALRDLPK